MNDDSVNDNPVEAETEEPEPESTIEQIEELEDVVDEVIDSIIDDTAEGVDADDEKSEDG